MNYIRRSLKRALVRMLLYPVFALVLAILYLSTWGFPSWLLRDLRARIPTRDFVVEAGAARLDVTRGLVLEDVTLYRKRVPGPAALQAGQVVIRVDPFAFVTHNNWINKVSVSQGVFQPAMFTASDGVREIPSGTAADVRVELDHDTLYGVEVEKLSLLIHVDSTGVRCEEMDGVLRSENWTGPFSGSMRYDARSRVLDGHLETHFDPRVLLPLFEAWDMPFAAEMAERFDFSDAPPRCEGDFRKSFADDDTFRMNVGFGFENGKYRGIDLTRADGRINMDFSPFHSLVTVNPLQFVRPDGAASGQFTVNATTKVVEFDGESSLNPKTLAQMIGILTNGVLDSCHFNGPLKMTGRGRASYSSYSNLDFEVTFDGHNTGLGRVLAQDCAFTMHMIGATDTVSDIHGRINGGDFLGSAVLVAPPLDSTNEFAYSMAAKFKDVDFEKSMKSLTTEKQEYSGQLSGHVTLQGLLGKGNLAAAQGEGAIKIREGKVFLMPLFGGFSATMAKIVPGVDFVLRQGDVTTEFTLSNGVIHTDKILVEGDVLSLTGHGDYRLDGKLDFNVQVKLLKEHTFAAKLLGIITYPISKLFEFGLRGTIREPRWHPVNFSRDLLEKLGLEKEKEDS